MSDCIPEKTAEQTALELARQGRKALRGKSPAEAREKYLAALSISPNPEWRLALARAWAMEGKYEEAEREASSAVAQDPASASGLVVLSKILAKKGSARESLAAADRALAIDPALAAAHYQRGLALSELGEFPAALAAVDRAIGGAKNPKESWLRAGSNLHRKIGDLNKALQYAQRANARAEQPTAKQIAVVDDLRARLANGDAVASREATALYYDSVYRNDPEFGQNDSESLYLPVWMRLADALRQNGVTNILDIGCGPGQFAYFIGAQMPGVSYTGVDFSLAAIEMARLRCPQFSFRQSDARSLDIAALGAFDAIVCTEVLEHVEADVALIEALPAGIRFFGSVPSYDSFGHVRFFADAAEVEARYRPLLSSFHVEDIPITAKSRIFLMSGITA